MRRVICKAGDTAPGTVTVTLQRGDTVVIVRDVPAAVCRNCGEYYLDEAVASKLYRQGEAAVQRHAEVAALWGSACGENPAAGSGFAPFPYVRTSQ